jgi:hypothetical protein
MQCFVVRIHALYVRLRVRQNEWIRIRSTASKSFIFGTEAVWERWSLKRHPGGEIQAQLPLQGLAARQVQQPHRSARRSRQRVGTSPDRRVPYTLHPVLRFRVSGFFWIMIWEFCRIRIHKFKAKKM